MFRCYLLIIFLCLQIGCTSTKFAMNETEILESMAFQILSQKGFENKEYCLSVFGKKPSLQLADRLVLINQNPNVCNTGGSVYLSNLQYDNKKYYVTYGYFCGDLCAAQFKCVFDRSSINPKLERCDLKWIS
jgi:hypothetical protein